MKRVVVFTGAGVSADSGIATFRASDGLWASHRIEDVCTPEALATNRAAVIDFYNTRRKELLSKEPNQGHLSLVELEKYFDVDIITQNIDDLHERAGSSKITHLHGELRKLRSSRSELDTVDIIGLEQKMDDCHSDGSLLRPYVVFFGESVPMFDKAVDIVSKADILIVIGTSLAVYPAASLVHYAPKDIPIFFVDPSDIDTIRLGSRVKHIKMRGVEGVPILTKELIADFV